MNRDAGSGCIPPGNALSVAVVLVLHPVRAGIGTRDGVIWPVTVIALAVVSAVTVCVVGDPGFCLDAGAPRLPECVWVVHIGCAALGRTIPKCVIREARPRVPGHSGQPIQGVIAE